VSLLDEDEYSDNPTMSNDEEDDDVLQEVMQLSAR
jgi:hypothetical protein